MILTALGDPPPDIPIEAAARVLGEGGIVGIPTDTVYGVAADPFHSGASDRLFSLKRRPRSFELPVLVADVDQALSLAVAVPDVARALMRRWWPGALTLVVPRRPDLVADLGEEDATIGLRCADHPVPLALCRMFGPIAVTSANRHGDPPATSAEEVVAAFGPSVELVLDAGPCRGEASTVVDCTGMEPHLLRAGALSWERIRASGDDGSR